MSSATNGLVLSVLKKMNENRIEQKHQQYKFTKSMHSLIHLHKYMLNIELLQI